MSCRWYCIYETGFLSFRPVSLARLRPNIHLQKSAEQMIRNNSYKKNLMLVESVHSPGAETDEEGIVGHGRVGRQRAQTVGGRQRLKTIETSQSCVRG